MVLSKMEINVYVIKLPLIELKINIKKQEKVFLMELKMLKQLQNF